MAVMGEGLQIQIGKGKEKNKTKQKQNQSSSESRQVFSLGPLGNEHGNECLKCFERGQRSGVGGGGGCESAR